jgi:hypothetical protein
MRLRSTCAAAAVFAIGAAFAIPQAQQQAPATPAPGQAPGQKPPAGAKPTEPMSFFVTSVPIGRGGNLGGLDGADAHCQKLAEAVGAGNRTWRAYLSTQGPKAVNARDRIGKGPWHNVKGTAVGDNLEHLHGDTLELARLGNRVTRVTALTEKGEPVKGAGETPNQHDILTGTQPDGRAYPEGKDLTCNNWTSDSQGNAQVGHHDRAGGPNISWNSVHQSAGCSQEALVKTGGAGLFYCFASGEPR